MHNFWCTTFLGFRSLFALFVGSHRQLALLRRLVHLRILLKGEIAIGEAHAHERSTEPAIMGAFEVEAWLHNGWGSDAPHTLAVRT